MFAHNEFEKRQKRRQESIRLRRDFALICVFLFIIAQLLPAAASGSQIWAQICDQNGVYAALVEQGSEPPAQHSSKCPLCLTRCDDLSGATQQAISEIHSNHFTKVLHPGLVGPFVPGIGWAWHTCRGPPIASARNVMTLSACLADQSLIEPATANPWSTPWI